MGNNNHQIYSQLVDQPIKPSRFKRICVFCGSSTGNKPSYQLAAVQLGNQLVERNIDLVYGGGSIGLMGLIFKAVFNGGRHVLGVIPKSLMPREVIALQITGETVGEVRAVSGMHQRKAEMARQADAFIALPGGYGTLEELLEVITWALLGIHDKPVGLLNVDGYYNSLLSFIDKAVDEGFITPSAHHIIVSASTAHELMSKLEVFRLWIKELIRQARDNYRRSVIPVTVQDPTTSAYENNKLWIKELIRQARDNYRRSYYFRLREQQDYVPKHNGVAPKLSWEIEQQLCYAAKSEIVR